METCTRGHLEKFTDYDSCVKLVGELIASPIDEPGYDQFKIRAETERLVENLKNIVDKYQEQPELLEPHLASLVEKLTSYLNQVKQAGNKYHTIFKFLYQLIKVVGFKTAGKKFPHETDKLPLVNNLLDHESVQDRENWQTRYVLTIWLSIAVLAPFDLAKFDPPKSCNDNLATRIHSTLMKGLRHSDSCQHVTAFCLAKFFSRPDTLKERAMLDKFVDQSVKELSIVKSTLASSQDDALLIGYLYTLAYVFKFLPRHELQRYIPPMIDVIAKLELQDLRRDHVNLLVLKIAQRIGLNLLPVKASAWRYKRGSRILGQVATVKSHDEALSESRPVSEYVTINVVNEGGQTFSDDATVEEVESAEILESILSILLVAAQNKHTKLRWSAAKGIARLASKLSRNRAGDVLDMVLSNYFNDTSSEWAWHGGCLALAEMSRNGLIIEEKLDEVTKIITKAIIYDKIKGSFAVGAHVREAACYVIWAMSRTYEDHLLKPYIGDISVNLMCTMLFDRELQCRRAASATFQEMLGRQGTFDGTNIDILTNVDYQGVCVRQIAYCALAVQVAQHKPHFHEHFVSHLLNLKIGHWDVDIRRTACDALGALMLNLSCDFIKKSVLPQLYNMIDQKADINMKHGAILGLSKVARSLVPLNYNFDDNNFNEPKFVDIIASVAKKCSCELLTKGHSQNFYEAMSNIILAAEVAKLQYDTDFVVQKKKAHEVRDMFGTEITLYQWELIVYNALENDNAKVREVASDALLALYRHFYAKNKTCQDRVLTTLNQWLVSPCESSRCGALRSLAKLGQALSASKSIGDLCGDLTQIKNNSDSSLSGTDNAASLCAVEPTVSKSSEIRVDADVPDIILMSITRYISKETHEKPNDFVYAQAKAQACESLVDFIKCLDHSQLIVRLQWLNVSYEVLLAKCEDYTFDKRGDIGVLVRRAAIKSLLQLTQYLLSINLTSNLRASLFDRERMTNIVGRVLQQAVSYNDSAREQAASGFYQLIAHLGTESTLLPNDSVPHKQDIVALFDKYSADSAFNWRDKSTSIFVRLLDKREYARDLWLGLVPALGQPSDLCARQFRDSLSEYIGELTKEDTTTGSESVRVEGKSKVECVLEPLLELLEESLEGKRPPDGSAKITGRLIPAGLVATDFMLTQDLMKSTSSQFQMRLVDFCWRARDPKDLKRLTLVARALCSMSQFSGPASVAGLKHCLSLLLNGYSRVRAFAAEQLYSALLTYQDELEESLAASLGRLECSSSPAPSGISDETTTISYTPSSVISQHSSVGTDVNSSCDGGGIRKRADLDRAMELLSATKWTEPLPKIKRAHEQICASMLIKM